MQPASGSEVNARPRRDYPSGPWRIPRRFKAAKHGVFAVPALSEEATNRAVVLLVYGQLESQIAELSTEGTEEQQVSRLSDIDLELERVRAGLDTVRTRLRTTPKRHQHEDNPLL